MSSLFITGTDTGVGKTIITASLTALLRAQGKKAIPMKPVQTDGIPAADLEVYRQITGLPLKEKAINPYCFTPPASPLIAARLTPKTIDLTKIKTAYLQLKKKYEIVLVEGAGGLAVPFTPTYTFADLARELKLPLLIVARPSLGTINHTVLTVNYALQHGLQVKGIIINGFQNEKATTIEKSNPRVIELLTGIPILGVLPYLKNLEKQQLIKIFMETIEWSKLFEED